MPAGRPPKYTPEERQAQGNPTRRGADPDASAADLPEPLSHVPDPPELINSSSDADALAMQAWRVVAPVLIEQRTFRSGDEIALSRYCRYLAEWSLCTTDIDHRGMVIDTGRGEQRNPSHMARMQIETAMRALEQELGLGPTSRVLATSRLMKSLRDLPLAGEQTRRGDDRGPIGILGDD